MATLSEKHEFTFTIPSASIMRERAEKRAKEREEERIKEEAIAKQKPEEEMFMQMLMRLPEIISLIVEDITKAVERGETFLRGEEWYVGKTTWGMHWYEVEEFAPILVEILGKAGYEMSPNFWTYSKSWRKRSGKALSGGRICWRKN